MYRGLISEDEYEEVRTEARLAYLALQEAWEKRHIADLEFRRAVAALRLGSIRSPVTGVVVERFLSVGETVTKSSQATIVQIHSWFIQTCPEPVCEKESTLGIPPLLQISRPAASSHHVSAPDTAGCIQATAPSVARNAATNSSGRSAGRSEACAVVLLMMRLGSGRAEGAPEYHEPLAPGWTRNPPARKALA